MLYTNTQREWQELLLREIHGENIETFLEPGYQAEYLAWKEKEKENLYKLSAEERVEHFTAYLQNVLLQKKQELIEALPLDEEKKKELSALAKKDQLLLVSKDGGAHFDEVLTKQEAEKVNPLKYRLLSPTLISASTDLGPVVEEQTLLHVVSNLKGVGYNVDAAEIKNHRVTLEVTLPKAQGEEQQLHFEVLVDQNPLTPLVYEYLSQSGIQHVPETILPEELDRLKEAAIWKLKTQENLEKFTFLNQSLKEGSGDSDFKENLALASFAGIYAANGRKPKVPEKFEKEDQSKQAPNHEWYRLHTEAPFFNVMASKQKRENQRTEVKKQEEDNAIRKASRDKKYEKDRLKALEHNAKEEERKIQSRRRGENRFKIGAILGSAAGTGFVGGIGFLGIFSGQ